MEKAKQYFCAKPNGKLHYPHTILTGFGFLASSIAWAIYDPYITKILNHLLNNSATITSWSAKLNAAFPALAEFAAANGEDVTTAAGGITLVPLFIGIIMTFDNIFGVISSRPSASFPITPIPVSASAVRMLSSARLSRLSSLR